MQPSWKWHLGPVYHGTRSERFSKCGYRWRVALKKPMKNPINKLKRYKWAKKHQQKGMEFWKQVIWSDESKFCQFSNSACIYVWRTISESWKSPCLQAMVKHCGIGMLVWEAVWYKGRSSLIFVEDRLNGAKYNGILEDGLLPLYQDKLDKTTTPFQEHGAPCHTCRISKAWKNAHGIKTLEWVAQSPDFNLIEHVWEHLDRKIRARKVKAKSVADLKRMLLEEWETMDQSFIQQLVNSMPDRIEAVIAARGGSTHF